MSEWYETDPVISESQPPALAPIDARSDAHLALVNRYRLEFAQGARAVSAVSGHLAILAETGDPHGVFDQQIEVWASLVRQVDNTLTCLRSLADSKGTA